MGLAGSGDIMLTCFGSLSRNRQCGCRLAKGESLDDIIKDIGTVEGVPTLTVIYNMIEKKKMENINLIPSIYKVFYEGLKLEDAFDMAWKDNHHHEFFGLEFGKES